MLDLKNKIDRMFLYDMEKRYERLVWFCRQLTPSDPIYVDRTFDREGTPDDKLLYGPMYKEWVAEMGADEDDFESNLAFATGVLAGLRWVKFGVELSIEDAIEEFPSVNVF